MDQFLSWFLEPFIFGMVGAITALWISERRKNR
jgi:hypothetical protein